MSNLAKVRSQAERFNAPVAADHKDVAPTPLFRAEALNAHRTQWLGTVLLEPKFSSQALTFGALIAALAIIAFLFLGTFTRKAHIGGLLISDQGLARIFAPQAGIIARIHVTEGAHVEKGDALVTLSSEVQSEARGATRRSVVEQLQNRKSNLIASRLTLEGQLAEQTSDLNRRLAIARSRLKISDESLARERVLRQRDLIALTRLQRSEQDNLDQQSALATLEGAARDLPFKGKTQLAEIDRNIAQIEQELTEAEAKREIVLVAPEAGIVSGLQAELGSSAQPSVPLMNIVPKGAHLMAQLFGNSRAIGFIVTGQRVSIRYQAFPYQKYGSYSGNVATISRSAISPSELPQQLTGLSSVFGANEPIYRITVSLDRQTAMVNGKDVALQPGMQVDADVLMETRPLIEWILEPLFSLTGKWQA